MTDGRLTELRAKYANHPSRAARPTGDEVATPAEVFELHDQEYTGRIDPAGMLAPGFACACSGCSRGCPLCHCEHLRIEMQAVRTGQDRAGLLQQALDRSRDERTTDG